MRNASNKILRLAALLSISYDHFCCKSESISLFLSTYLPFLPHTLICSFYFQFTNDPPKMSANRFTWNIIALKETNDWLKLVLVIPWQFHCVIQTNMRSLVDCVQPARCLCFYMTKEWKRVSLDVQTRTQIPFKNTALFLLFLFYTLLWCITRLCGMLRHSIKRVNMAGI